MTFLELIAQLKTCFAPLDLEAFEGEFGYTANSRAAVQRIGCATNLSPSIAARAIEEGLDTLITHHDAWDFLYESRDEVYETLKAHEISHCYIHAPLDAADFGTTVSLAELLLLQVKDGFAEYEGLPCGRTCVPSAPVSFDELAARLLSATGAGIRVWRNHSLPIQSVGVTTGGGSLTSIVREAAALGCDTYITGETNLYVAQYAKDRGINLMIGTHTHTEFPGIERLCRRLQTLAKATLIPLREDDIETGTLIQEG